MWSGRCFNFKIKIWDEYNVIEPLKAQHWTSIYAYRTSTGIEIVSLGSRTNIQMMLPLHKYLENIASEIPL